MGVDLAVVAVVASVIGAGVSAYSAMQQGEAQAQASRYQQQVAVINAQTAKRNQALAERNAQYEGAAGARAADDQARRVRGAIGAQRAAFAGNGLLLDGTGTAADVQDDTAMLGGLAIGEIRDNAARRAAGYRIAGLNAGAEAEAASLRGQMYGDSASAAETAGLLNAGSSILGGASRAYSQWTDMQRTGVPIAQPPAVV